MMIGFRIWGIFSLGNNMRNLVILFQPIMNHMALKTCSIPSEIMYTIYAKSFQHTWSGGLPAARTRQTIGETGCELPGCAYDFDVGVERVNIIKTIIQFAEAGKLDQVWLQKMELSADMASKKKWLRIVHPGNPFGLV